MENLLGIVKQMSVAVRRATFQLPEHYHCALDDNLLDKVSVQEMNDEFARGLVGWMQRCFTFWDTTHRTHPDAPFEFGVSDADVAPVSLRPSSVRSSLHTSLHPSLRPYSI